MAQTTVKYFAVIMTGHIEHLNSILEALEKYFGGPDYTGAWHDFTFTDFYEPEMGAGLKRCIVSFEKTFSPSILPQAKKWTQDVEDMFKKDGKRPVNIDAGYIDFCKVVLASGKTGGHKIAVTEECYADMIMDFKKGEWHPLPWCFPDFAGGTYNLELTEIREIYKARSNQLYF